MKLKEDKNELVTLNGAEVKLILAALMRVREDSSEFTSRFMDATISGLSLALFGDNSIQLQVSDVEHLHREAYAEWRKG